MSQENGKNGEWCTRKARNERKKRMKERGGKEKRRRVRRRACTHTHTRSNFSRHTRSAGVSQRASRGTEARTKWAQMIHFLRYICFSGYEISQRKQKASRSLISLICSRKRKRERSVREWKTSFVLTALISRALFISSSVSLSPELPLLSALNHFYRILRGHCVLKLLLLSFFSCLV